MCVCVCLSVYVQVSVLIYSAMSYNVYSGSSMLYLVVAVLCCIIRSCSYSSTIPVCALREEISWRAKAMTRQGFFSLDWHSIAASGVLLLLLRLCHLLLFSSSVRNENVLVKSAWTLRRSPSPSSYSIHSFRYAHVQNAKERRRRRRRPVQSNRIAIENFPSLFRRRRRRIHQRYSAIREVYQKENEESEACMSSVLQPGLIADRVTYCLQRGQVSLRTW